MAICYRKDLFAKAGLPTDRDAVAKLWAGGWGKYLDVGERFKDKAPAVRPSWTPPPVSTTR